MLPLLRLLLLLRSLAGKTWSCLVLILVLVVVVAVTVVRWEVSVKVSNCVEMSVCEKVDAEEKARR